MDSLFHSAFSPLPISLVQFFVGFISFCSLISFLPLLLILFFFFKKMY